MKDEDLEKTIPIETLDEIEEKPQTREDKNKEEATTRESKYEKVVEEETEEEKIEEKAEETEKAEEALAEKNIAEAEKIIEKEKKKAELPPEDEEDEQLKKKIKKVMIIAGIVVGVAILVVSIVLLITNNKKKKSSSDSDDTKKEELSNVIPEIKDNFYYQDGKVVLTDDKEKPIGEYECTNKDENLCFVAYNDNNDEFDVDLYLNEKEEEKKQRLGTYDKNFAFIFDNKNLTDKTIVLYSLKDNKKIDEYNDVKAYKDGYVIVANTSNKYGLLQITNEVKTIIEPTYDYLGKIDDEDNLVAKKNNGYVIINKDNKTLSASIPNAINNYNSKLIVAKSGKDYNVYNYEGTLVVGGYSFATIKDNYIALVNNKKLTIRDGSNNKYNETPVSLNNTYYVHRNIYDDDNKLDRTLASFDINIKTDTIEVVVYDKEAKDGKYTQIEKINAIANSKYQYMNYFDKTLYFYSDESKEKLIGTYECKNENNLTESDYSFQKCNVATDTVYEDNELNPKENRNSTIPIINNRFVFIADGTNTVVLYDLVDKKEKVTYTSVNTYTPDNGNNLTLYNGKKNVVALNKSGSYGMVNIDGSNVTKVYDFKYNKLEKMGDYYLAEDSDGKWLLIYSSNSTSAKFPGKIANFTKDRKYFKIKKDDSYQVYDANGSSVVNDKFKKVTFLDSYFMAVTSNGDMFLYKYDGTKINNVALKDGKTCSLDHEYKVSVTGNIYTISVCDGDKYTDYKYDSVAKKFVEDQTEPKDEPEEKEPDKSNED